MAPQGALTTYFGASQTSFVTVPTPVITHITATPAYAAPIWRERPTSLSDYDSTCTPFKLPSSGLVGLSAESTITLEVDATFTPLCIINGNASYLDGNNHVPQSELRDPFYASAIPMAYAIGGTTVLAYVLMFILLVSPPGSRPFFQKVATFTVVLSLTIAWAELNDVVMHQYAHGYQNGNQIRDHIIKGLKIKIARVISDTFLYLAQVQTLIRLFPRHREKLVIKWAGIILVVLDTVFNIVNTFFAKKSASRSFLDAIPALSYLLQIALSLLYASCVLYYMFSHRQFSVMLPWSINNRHKHAETTSKMAMPLIAIVTTATIFVPLAFFVLDISNADLAGWGDFVRWIGACAASVIVWEMADRIEYFEKLNIKAGILGRQVYEGDEMLQGIGGRVVDWGNRNDRNGGPGDSNNGDYGGGGVLGKQVDGNDEKGWNQNGDNNNRKEQGDAPAYPRGTPTLSRATTGSTTYVIRVHPSSITPPPHHIRSSSAASHTPSSTRETGRGTSTISDLAISPSDTPSNDTSTNAAPRRNITFSANTTSSSSTGIGKSKKLPHTYRAGQAPFNPEVFSPKDSESSGHLVGLKRGLGGLMKRFRGEEREPEQVVIAYEGNQPPQTHQTTALGHEVDSSHTTTNVVAVQYPTEENEPFSDSNAIDQPRNPNAAIIRTTTAKFVPKSDHADDDRSGPASFFKNLWNRKGGNPEKTTNFEPLPITYIPAQFRGNKAIDPEEVEAARDRERERIRSGESSSEGTSTPSNSGDVIVTRFEAPASQRSSRVPSESPLHSSTSPASRLRHSVEFDMDAHSHPSASSPRAPQVNRLPVNSQGQGTPPPPTRSSTASPSAVSIKTSSTGSWQYKAGPNAGGYRMAPVTRHVAGTDGDRRSSPSHSSSPESFSNTNQGKKSPAPTKPSGTSLNPAVIPEEAEASSMISAHGPGDDEDDNDAGSNVVEKGKAKADDTLTH